MTNAVNKYGLADRDIQTIHGIFRKYPGVLLVHIFGSRAKGISKPGSDIDLAIMNRLPDLKLLLRLKNDFEESSLPYKVDLIEFQALTNQNFIDHIKRVGEVFYQRESDNNSSGNIYQRLTDTTEKALETLRGSAAEPEMEYLSNIVKAFNEKFGTTFTNEDKVRKMTQDLMQDVKDDKAAMDNISASLSKNDLQNAQITFADILKEKMINHIDSNFEVFKEYNENSEFKAFLAGQMFKLFINDVKMKPE